MSKLISKVVVPDPNESGGYSLYNIKDADAIRSSEKGSINGVATLNDSGKVPSSQLPSYVDDVIEGYYNETDGKFYEDDLYTTEITAEGGKIYIDVSTEKTYRWSGSAYAAIKGDIIIGTATGTAADGKVVNDHITNTDIHITATERALWDSKYTKPSGGIPDSDLATTYLPLAGRGSNIPDNSDLNTYTTAGKYYCANSTHASTLTNPPTTGSGFTLIVYVNYTTNRLIQKAFGSNYYTHFRYTDDGGATWSAWRSFAYTDSNISGNAATATALAASRTIWGNNFDGTGDVSGDIVLPNSTAVYGKTTGGTNSELLEVTTADNVRIGYGLRSATDSCTYIYSGTGGMHLRTNGANTRAFIDSAGNIGVGTTDPTEKLEVAGGNILASRTNTTKTKVQALNSNGSIAIDVTTNRGLINPDLGTWLIATNKAGENTWLPQGNVGIGLSVGTSLSYKLQVDGSFSATAAQLTSINGVTVGSSPKFTDTTYSNFVKSGSGAKAGLVPSPGTTAGTTKYLREDGTWLVPPDNDTTYSSYSASSGSSTVSLCTRGEKYTWNNKQNKVAALGSTTKPVYTSDDGTFAECSTYAGGTKVTLNGSGKGGSTASFYAPTSAGTSGYLLLSNGSGAPSWVSASTAQGITFLTGSGSKALPSSPVAGLIVYAKGTTGDMTVTTTSTYPVMTSEGRTTSTSVQITNESTIFIYMGGYWVRFRCN